ncbi:hypothetical protein JCM9279_003910 [Rhodotorula babjevae]
MFISSSDLALSLPYAFAASPAAPTSGLAFGSTSLTSSSSCSSGTTTQSASPTLYDLPTPPSAPISTPSPLASSSLALPFTSAPSPMHPLDAFETSLSSLPDWSATIDPSLLFGLEASSSKARPRAAQPPPTFTASSAPGRTFFPPGSPIHGEREQDRNVPLFGESTTHEQRMEQVAALSSLIINGSAAARSSSSGPVKRTRSTKAKDGRSRSLSQGRPSSASTSKPAAVAAAAPRGGRRLSDDAHMVVESSSSSTTPPRPTARSTSPGHSPTRSWLDALREAEAKAKLKRLQHAAAMGSAASGTTSGAPRGRLALMHGQLLAQSMEAEAQGVPAASLPPATGGGLTVFPWGRA